MGIPDTCLEQLDEEDLLGFFTCISQEGELAPSALARVFVTLWQTGTGDSDSYMELLRRFHESVPPDDFVALVLRLDGDLGEHPALRASMTTYVALAVLGIETPDEVEACASAFARTENASDPERLQRILVLGLASTAPGTAASAAAATHAREWTQDVDLPNSVRRQAAIAYVRNREEVSGLRSALLDVSQDLYPGGSADLQLLVKLCAEATLRERVSRAEALAIMRDLSNMMPEAWFEARRTGFSWGFEPELSSLSKGLAQAADSY